MKIEIARISLVGLFLLALIACSGKKESGEGHDAGDAWPEMDAFHEIMADSYHPMRDDSTLVPAKEKASAMAAAAEKWADASLPSKVDNEDMKNRLDKLRTDTKAFADRVAANAPDEELSASLENLHETFHEVMEMWHKAGH